MIEFDVVGCYVEVQYVGVGVSYQDCQCIVDVGVGINQELGFVYGLLCECRVGQFKCNVVFGIMYYVCVQCVVLLIQCLISCLVVCVWLCSIVLFILCMVLSR